MTRPQRVKERPFPIISQSGGMGGVSIPASSIPPISLDDLTDVDTTGVLDGDALVFEYGLWVPGSVTTTGRWELAVITGSPPDPLYADGDFLYIFVP